MTHVSVPVLDFGGQTAQLLVRRVRELGVYSELLAHDTAEEAVRKLNPRGVILSGGPASVYEPGAPQMPAWLLDAGDDETRTLLGQGELRDEAQAWLDGANIEPASGPTRKVPLPGYAFLRRRYWIETAPLPVGASSLAKNRPAVPKPLTPQDILDRLARQEITQEQARSLLKALL